MKLVIAEKPSVAKAIAPIIGATVKKDGYMEGNGCVVSWCFGHLVEPMLPNDYGGEWAQRWSFSQLPMIPQNWQLKVSEDKDCARQFEVLKRLLNDSSVTKIVCATDADRYHDSFR